MKNNFRQQEGDWTQKKQVEFKSKIPGKMMVILVNYSI